MKYRLIIPPLFLLFAIISTIAFLGNPPSVVSANTSQPSTIDLDYLRANRNLIETGDINIHGRYNIVYSENSTPDDTIDFTFAFRLMDSTDTIEYAQTLAYPYTNSGYGYGVINFYLNATNNPGWGQVYHIRISQNPEKFDTPIDTIIVLNASDYFSDNTTSANKQDFADSIVNLAGLLESAWTPIELLSQSDTGIVLSDNGEYYFRRAIPGLQAMAPSLFMTQIDDPDFTERTFANTQAATYAGRFSGTWVEESMTDVGNLFNTNYSMIGSLIILVGCIGMIIVSAKTVGKATPGMICSALLIVGGTALGWIPFQILGIIIILALFYDGAKLVSLLT